MRDASVLFTLSEAVATPRKLRLFACACCRRSWDHFTTTARRAVEAAEQYADDPAKRQELVEARQAVYQEIARPSRSTPQGHNVNHARMAAWKATIAETDGIHPRPMPESVAARAVLTHIAALEAERGLPGYSGKEQAKIIRDLIWCPGETLPTVHEEWLRHDAGRVVQVAEHIYQTQAPDYFALHDALKEAGCDNQILLDHCCQNSSHVRGCWLIDLLTNRC
jgi:hypothetical protein